MTSTNTKSSQNSQVSRMEKLRREKFVLLARVGQRKREASRLREEVEFYYGTVTELLAISGEAMALLRKTADKDDPVIADLMSRHTSQTKRLLSYWPPSLESQQRASDLLECAGLEMVTANTADGFVTLSMDLMLENVERIIEATKKEELQKASSS